MLEVKSTYTVTYYTNNAEHSTLVLADDFQHAAALVGRAFKGAGIISVTYYGPICVEKDNGSVPM